LVGRDRERGILIVVRDPGTSFPGQFPVAALGKCLFQSRLRKQFKFLDPTVMET